MGGRMRGYPVSSGYIGYVASENRYILFACENDYLEYMEE